MNISSRISDSIVMPGVRVLTAPTGAQDIVTIYGSMLGGHSFGPKQSPMVPEMTVVMLDEGTERHTKEEIHTILESVGASLHFSCFSHDIGFSIQCLKKDVPLVLDLLAEQLRIPLFDPEQLAIQKKRAIGDLVRAKDDTGKQSEITLSQCLFPKDHPNYDENIDAVIEQVEKVTSEDLKSYHAASYGLGSLTLVATGDVQASALEKLVAKVFAGWRDSSLALGHRTLQGKMTSKALQIIPMKDKTSVDVNMGLALGIDRNHPDYYPLSIANQVFGGHGFSARLMANVRDKQGLTYGVYSGVGGTREGDDGYWYVWGTFAPELLTKGIAAIDQQVRQWHAKGITAKELAHAKDTVTGGYKVGLATTRGRASRILNVIEQGKPKEFLDEYPDFIRSISLKQANDAIKRYIDPQKIVTIAAGSVDPKGGPLV
jgi:zinc protease